MLLEKELIPNTYDISLEEQLAVLNSAFSFQDSQPVPKSSKEELISVHLNNIALLKEASKSREPRPLVLPAAYAPSISSLNDLQKISITDLKVEVHHRGCFVTAKTITPAYLSTNVITIIEAEDGSVAKLEIGFQDPLLPSSDLPENSTVAIKEPYFKYLGEGDYAIRVDHPSDIAVLRGDDPAVSMIMDVVSKTKDITPSEWKTAGDKAYLEKNYSSAIECYTQAIDNSPKEDEAFIRDVYRKRAYANLTGGRFNFAVDDALASCSGDAVDGRAHYCAGRAAYELGLYDESKDHFEKALESNPRDSKYRKDYNRAKARIGEQEEGLYDFKAMAEALNEQNVHLDHADFIRNTMIAKTEKKGRGLFATRFIPRGSLVLCEKAFAFPNMSNGEERAHGILFNHNTNTKTKGIAQGALFMHLIQKLYNNPILTSRFFECDSGNYIRSGKEGELVDGIPIIDVFLIEAIRLKSGFSYHESYFRQNTRSKGSKSTGTRGDLHTGFWTRAAYLNHSCIPNCARSFVGDIMVLRAICDIPIGTELTQQYTVPEAAFKARQEIFRGNWDFECDCMLCGGERASPDEKHQQRRDLVAKIRGEAVKWPRNARVPEAAIRSIERLLKKMEALHEPEIYSTLPRLLLVTPTIWLTEVNRSKKNWAKTARYAVEVLRNFGFVDPIRDGRVMLDYEAGIVNSESFNALQYGMEAFKELGKSDLSKQCEIEARKMFAIITGDDEGVNEALVRDE